MSWFPTFLSGWTAIIAAAIAVPALLVLYFLKLRRREMVVSSTILWRKAVQDLQVNSPFQKLRKNLLLLLQMLLLLILCLALSRPVVNANQKPGKLTVILIDRSASMAAKDAGEDGKTARLAEAKRLAKDLVASMGRDDHACVVAFDEGAETLAPLTSDQARLRNAIDSIKQTDRPSRLKLAYQLAEAQSSFIPEQNRANVKPDVFLYSDGRTVDATTVAAQQINVKFQQLGREDTPNVAIVALSAKRNYERPTEVQVFARLANFGPEPVEADVNLQVATEFTPGPTFQISKSAAVYLYPERWDDKRREAFARTPGSPSPKDSVEFKLDLTTAAVVKLEKIAKTPDALTADDVAHVVIPPPKALSVLLVTDGNFYLEKLRQSNSYKEFDLLNPIAYEDAKPAKYDVIIFDRYQPKWTPPTGNFMYFGAIPPNTKIKQVKAGLRSEVIEDNGVLDWKRDHPMLRGIKFDKVFAKYMLKLELPMGVERLVDGTKGPLVLLTRDGRSTYLIVTFDVMESTWPLRLSFPVFMYNALQYLALGSEMDVRESYAPGETPRIPLADVRRVAGDKPEIGLNGPTGGKRVKIPAVGDFVLPALDQTGFYQLDTPVAGYDRIAVNLVDANESNLMPATAPPGGVGETRTAGGKSRVEIWWWLAVLALPLLLIEWWVYTRRVHL
ncbi:MAG TPA: VWA domain-containing protein [Tepidisphaeraceae bacterium]|nr:VWA domain-containing protein [Tepidisphaeraceae bacterium]